MKEQNKRMGRREFIKAATVLGGVALLKVTDKITGPFIVVNSVPDQAPTVETPALNFAPTPEIPDPCIPRGTTPEMVEFLTNHETRRADARRNVVLMTYDDMGNHERFNTILDAYRDLGAKATFFLPGGYERDQIILRLYSSEIERIITEGHVFGCHGLIHDPLTTYNSDLIRNDIEEWLRIAAEIAPGYQVKYFRFPYGDSNERARGIFAEYGLQSILWSLESGGTEENTLHNVLDRVSAGDIVLNHNHRYYDAYYAGRIVENLLASGFSLETVETGLNPEDYLPNRLDPRRCLSTPYRYRVPSDYE